MSAPPRKRLKQTTLTESFKKRESNKQRQGPETSPGQPDQEASEGSMSIRERTLAAAESRRFHKSPDITPHDTPDDTANSSARDTTPEAELPSTDERGGGEAGEENKRNLRSSGRNTNPEQKLGPTGSDLIDALAESETTDKATEIHEEETASTCVEARETKKNLTATKRKSQIEEINSDSDELEVISIDPEEGTSTASTSKYFAGADKEVISDSDDCQIVGMGSCASDMNMTTSEKSLPMYRKTSMSKELGPKGTPASELNTQPSCSAALPKIVPTPHHTVLFDTRRFSPDDRPRPFPREYEDKWDSDHVKMPCSPDNEYPVEVNGKKELKKRWKVIERALLTEMTSSLDLEDAILKYNKRYEQKWNFSGLHSFFTDILDTQSTQKFFKTTLPKMIELALQLPKLCTRGIPLLRKNYPHSISMSQEQAACLLANAFFCTFPRRNAHGRSSEYSSYPDINFNNLYVGTKHGINQRKAEKLKCLINYFRRVTERMPQGTLTYRRQVLRDFPDWAQSSRQLTCLHVATEGTIEDDGGGMLQVDFANKFVGGGVLGHGCVQEEIRFVLCPEMIVSRLFTEMLLRNECLIMTGCERFNNYTGYASSFEWKDNHNDISSRDEWGRRYTEVVAIDALVFHSYGAQFQEYELVRELNKAWCGFYKEEPTKHLSAIATGNWGCGAFGGDHRLKALIQLMAAAEARRDVCYFTFSDCDLRDDLHDMHTFLVKKNLNVGDIWKLIQEYQRYITRRSRRFMTLFDYIYNHQHNMEIQSIDTDSTTDRESVASCDIDLSQEMAYHRQNPEHPGGRSSPDYAANTP